jgi:tetratricopeptide (TPR) repeat protein
MLAGCCLACCLLATLQFLPQALHAGQNQVGRPPALDDAQTLRNAQSLLNIGNLDQAKQLAERIRDAQGSIGEEAKALIRTIDAINNNNTKLQNARIAITRGKFEEACGLLRDIQAAIDANKGLKERFPSLNDLKTKAGGCPALPAPPPPPPDTVKADYEKAVAQRDAGKLQDALVLFNRIRRSHPNYMDVDTQISEINQELIDNTKKSQDDKLAELLRSVSQSLTRGDLLGASRQLDRAEEMRPDDLRVKTQRQLIEKSLTAEKNEISNAIAAFYGGRYEEAQKTLEDFLGRPHSAFYMALARFYAGAALGSRFLLSGAKDESTKNAAMKMFEQTLKDDPGYSPRWDALSPKIKDLYAEATRRNPNSK